MIDFYNVLKISKSATISEIKASYRKLALQFHPDKSPAELRKTAEIKFKQISEAYETLKNQKSREKYDASLKSIPIKNSNMQEKVVRDSYVRTRSNFNRKHTPVPRKYLDEAAWNAFHYGDNAVVMDAITRKSNLWMDIPNSKHQKYYARQSMQDSASQAAAQAKEQARIQKEQSEFMKEASENLKNKRDSRISKESNTAFSCTVS